MYSAKRAAMLRVAEEEGLDTGKSKRVKKASKQFMKGAAAGGEAGAAAGAGGGKKRKD